MQEELIVEELRHPWQVTPAQAIAIQKELADKVVASDDVGEVRYVAGVDVGFEEKNTITRAAAAVLSFPELTLDEQKSRAEAATAAGAG